MNHAADRQQFGKPISRFGGIQEKLAHMALLLYVTEVSAAGQPPPWVPPSVLGAPLLDFRPV